MATALDVAHLLIRLAEGEEESDYLTHLRLQKLLYYVQGWSLAMRGEPMFEDRIEAWQHGPVVRSVYPKFADLGGRPILPENVAGIDDRDLSEAESDFVASVWNSYMGYSGNRLREMTHSEDPWIDARGGLPTHAPCTEEITKDALRGFFRRALDERD